MTRSPQAAEGVAQDAFLAPWRTAVTFDPSRASVRTWLLAVTRNLAVDRYRRGPTEARGNARMAGREPAPAPDPVGERVADRVDAAALRRALVTLPAGRRRVIELSFLDGRSHAQIAGELQIPIGTVKSRVRLGLDRLCGMLAGPLRSELG